MNIKKERRESLNLEVKNLLKKGDYEKSLELISEFKLSGFTITLTRAMKDYSIDKNELLGLIHLETPNPHYSKGSPMRLFLIYQLDSLYTQNSKAA